jgi:hypothetical protein
MKIDEYFHSIMSIGLDNINDITKFNNYILLRL